MAGEFDPNRLSFARCARRIAEAIRKVGLEPDKAGFKHEGRILTSRDEPMARLTEELRVDNVPAGFQKWQLPFFVDHPTHLFVTLAEPGATAPPHSHKEGDGIRFIVGGSIIYEDKELTAGDWMFVPAGAQYSFKAGRMGAAMCYCYAC